MSEENRYSEAEAHRHFAIEFHGKTWDLLDRAERTKEEDELMIHSAHASCRHWLEVGTGLHHQRGEWLIARVYSVLKIPEAALYHAQRCLELTEAHADLLEDFDRAFAYEAVARASAIAGISDQALRYIDMAEEAGHAIVDEQNQQVFLDDFHGGDWGGIR